MRLDEVTYVKCSAQCMAHSRHLTVCHTGNDHNYYWPANNSTLVKSIFFSSFPHLEKVFLVLFLGFFVLVLQ